MADQRYADGHGRTIGYLSESKGSEDEQRVMDANYQTLGYVSRNGTFDAGRRRISLARIPGLLLPRE
jgi:hypothetical protein